MKFESLDPLLHQELRLKIMSLLIGVKSAEFNYLLEETGSPETPTTKGNLSAQIKKLKEAGYIEVEKTFRDNYPLTTCKITPKGIEAFERYVETISKYLKL